MKKFALLTLTALLLLGANSSSFAYGYYHGYYHRHYYGYGPRFGISIGGPAYWGPSYYAPPVYVAPAPVYYAPPPVYVAPEQQTYIEKTPTPSFYCTSPAGYYPQVERCPKGWMKVTPQ